MPELEETAEKSQESFTPITALHQKKSSSGSKEDRIAILQTFPRPIKIDPPKFFENGEQALISALIVVGIFGILTIKACADAEWRPR